MDREGTGCEKAVTRSGDKCKIPRLKRFPLDFDWEGPLNLEAFIEFPGRTASRIGTVGFALNEPTIQEVSTNGGKNVSACHWKQQLQPNTTHIHNGQSS